MKAVLSLLVKSFANAALTFTKTAAVCALAASKVTCTSVESFESTSALSETVKSVPFTFNLVTSREWTPSENLISNDVFDVAVILDTVGAVTSELSYLNVAVVGLVVLFA